MLWKQSSNDPAGKERPKADLFSEKLHTPYEELRTHLNLKQDQ